MTRQKKITIGILLYGLWGLSAANGIKDFYFEMQYKARGEIISYSSLSEFCGWTGDRKPGESEWGYRSRAARNMFSAVMTMSFMSFTFFSCILGIIFGSFWLTGAFKDEDPDAVRFSAIAATVEGEKEA